MPSRDEVECEEIGKIALAAQVLKEASKASSPQLTKTNLVAQISSP
jgi:hypothetical protein